MFLTRNYSRFVVFVVVHLLVVRSSCSKSLRHDEPTASFTSSNSNNNSNSFDDYRLEVNKKVYTVKTRENLKRNENESDIDDDEDAESDFVINSDVTEFVAKVKGGLKQAKRIAHKFNLKLVKQVHTKTNSIAA